jgi:hypothetical protein
MVAASLPSARCSGLVPKGSICTDRIEPRANFPARKPSALPLAFGCHARNLLSSLVIGATLVYLFIKCDVK